MPDYCSADVFTVRHQTLGGIYLIVTIKDSVKKKSGSLSKAMGMLPPCNLPAAIIVVVEKTLLEWKPVNDRLMKVRFNSKFAKLTTIACYAPTEEAEEEEKDEFYEQLEEEIRTTPRHDVLMVIGDLNSRVGEDNTGKERAMGT